MRYVVYRATGKIVAMCYYKVDALLIAKQWHGAYVTNQNGERID